MSPEARTKARLETRLAPLHRLTDGQTKSVGAGSGSPRLAAQGQRGTQGDPPRATSRQGALETRGPGCRARPQELRGPRPRGPQAAAQGSGAPGTLRAGLRTPGRGAPPRLPLARRHHSRGQGGAGLGLSDHLAAGSAPPDSAARCPAPPSPALQGAGRRRARRLLGARGPGAEPAAGRGRGPSRKRSGGGECARSWAPGHPRERGVGLRLFPEVLSPGPEGRGSAAVWRCCVTETDMTLGTRAAPASGVCGSRVNERTLVLRSPRRPAPALPRYSVQSECRV